MFIQLSFGNITRGTCIVHRTPSPSANRCKPQCTQNVFYRPYIPSDAPAPLEDMVPGRTARRCRLVAGGGLLRQFYLRRFLMLAGAVGSSIWMRRHQVKFSRIHLRTLDKPIQTIRLVLSVHTHVYDMKEFHTYLCIFLQMCPLARQLSLPSQCHPNKVLTYSTKSSSS